MGKNNWGKIVINLPALNSDPLQDDSLESIDDDGGVRSDAARETVWPLLDTTQVMPRLASSSGPMANAWVSSTPCGESIKTTQSLGER